MTGATTDTRPRVSVIIPTLNGARWLDDLLTRLREQTLQPDEILVVDSGSTDATLSIAASHGVHLLEIPPGSFDHGGTRSLAVRHVQGELLVFLTQDAIPADREALARLVRPLAEDALIAAAYGRQLANPDATPCAAHLRLFNYPPESAVRSLDDRHRLGFKTIFISNSFAAYRRGPLERVGCFPEKLLFGGTALILGAGDIGTNVAQRLKAFGMSVVGVCRHRRPLPAGFDAGAKPADDGVGMVHGGGRFAGSRAEAMPGAVRLGEVEEQEPGSLRGGQVEPGERLVGPRFVGCRIVVPFPERRPDAGDFGFAAGPERRGGAETRPLCGDPDRLPFPPAPVLDGRAIGEREPRAEERILHRVGDDAVMLGAESGDDRVVVGIGLRRKLRHQRGGTDTVAGERQEVRCSVELRVVPAEAVERDDDQEWCRRRRRRHAVRLRMTPAGQDRCPVGQAEANGSPASHPARIGETVGCGGSGRRAPGHGHVPVSAGRQCASSRPRCGRPGGCRRGLRGR